MEEADETTALLPQDADAKQRTFRASARRNSSAGLILPIEHQRPNADESVSSTLAIWVVVPISLVGVFVSNADGSLVVASSQHIASEFDALYNAQWLVTSYVLVACASQPLYGKLSDIFGRKSNLITAYTFFAVGCFLCGIGKQYWQVLAGRAISGVGGAGMTALVSVIISDMVPIKDIAAWRSYVNVAATTGRALGGPVGGWLCDTIGWRWCFYGQVPFTVIGLLLILWKMPTSSAKRESAEEQTLSHKWKRIDTVGALTLAGAISAFLLALDFLAKELPWHWTLIPSLAFVLLSVTFYFVETRWANEPVLPMRLLVSRVALTSYLLAGFQIAAQFGTFYSTPLYYQLAASDSVSASGLRLVPAVVGNAVAGLLSGYVIAKTGRYKYPSVLASASASLGYTLIIVRWRGSVSWAETLYIFFGGFGSGAIQSTTFIHLAANLDLADMAIAGTALYTFQNVFLLIGVQSATTILHIHLRGALNVDLAGVKHKKKIIAIAVSSVRSIRSLPKQIREVVVEAYINSLTLSFGASLVFAVLGLITAISIQERKLD